MGKIFRDGENFSVIKMNFIERLEKRSNKLLQAKENADVSIFDYSGEFSKYFKELGYNSSDINVAIEDMLKSENYSVKNGELTADKAADLTESEEFMYAMLNDMLKNEKVLKALDTDKSGKIDQSELNKMLAGSYNLDKDETNLSAKDLMEAFSQIEKGTFKPGNDKEIEKALGVNQTNPFEQVQSRSNTNNYGNNNYDSGNNDVLQKETATIESLDNSINGYQQDLSSIAKGNYSGDFGDVKSAKETYDTAKKSLDSELTKDGSPEAKELQKVLKTIEEQTQIVDDTQAEIDSSKANIASLESDKNTYKSSLEETNSNLADAEAKGDKDLISSLTERKEELEKNIQECEDKIKEEEKKQEELQKKIDDANKIIDENTAKRQELEKKLSEKGSDELKNKLNEFSKAEKDLSEIKKKAAEECKKEISEAQTKRAELKKAEEERKDKSANGKDGQAIVDLAMQFLGYSEAAGNYTLFGTSDAWCAAFASYVAMKSGVDMSDCTARFAVSGLRDWGISKGIYSDGANSNPNNVQVGDFVIWKGSVFASHTGIVTHVYPDGTFDTIEGNSSNMVREKKGYKISEATGFVHTT